MVTQTWAAPALSETVYSGDEKEMIRSVEDENSQKYEMLRSFKV